MELYENKRIVSLVALVILVFSVTFMIFVFNYTNSSNKHEEIVHEVNPAIFFNNLNIEAEAAIVWDVVKQRALFSKNGSEILPLASVTKVLTAITALEIAPEGTVITINRDFLNEEGDAGLIEGESWSLRDLLSFGLVMSSNDAVAAVSAVAGKIYSNAPNYQIGRKEFVSKMNATARNIGMDDSVFYNPTGLDLDYNKSGAYSSVRDVAKLFSYTLDRHPNVLLPTRNDSLTISSLNNILHKATNTNLGINDIPNLMASKTGYTDLSGGNLAVVIDPGIGRPFVIAVLGSSIEGRFDDVERLSQATLVYLGAE